MSEKEIALITIHGMGEIKKDNQAYYLPLKEGLKKKFKEDWDKIHFEPIQYQPEFQVNQEFVWNKMQQGEGYHLYWNKLREFVLFGFGDAGALEHSRTHNPQLYLDIQLLIKDAFVNCYNALGDTSKPVIVFANSLGCQVISNYFWDSQHKKGLFKNHTANSELDEYVKGCTCNRLITTGCNIPLFVAGLDTIECFKPLNQNFKWYNYFDGDDILGWPLSTLSSKGNGRERQSNSKNPIHRFEDIVIDQEINVGKFYTSWNPFSHESYWEDKDVITMVASHILRALEYSGV